MVDKIEIERFADEVIKECMLLNIPVSKQIEQKIAINCRAKSRFACCKKQRIMGKTRFVIEVGEALMKADIHTVKGILAHEILHTCPGCYNHGLKWKQYAQLMNVNFGYAIKTRNTYEELGLDRPEKKSAVQFLITCKNCGSTFYRQRKSKLVTHTDQYRCKCGGKLICYSVKR